MKRLKQLRESSGFSQQQIASMLETTQQSIARWENGKAEPSLRALRDLALIFGVSVDDILGVSPSREKLRTTNYHILAGKEQDGFWGHVGLKLDDGFSKWFPVTIGTAEHVRAELGEIDSDAGWISFPTLANRFVAFRPSRARKIWLLDDACDQPEGDWENELPYEGLPLEMYRAFNRLGAAPISSEAWEAALAALPVEGGGGEAAGGDPEIWKAFLLQLADVFEGEASETFLNAVAKSFGELKLYNEEIYYRQMHKTSLYFVDGSNEELWISADNLNEFLLDIDDGTQRQVIAFEQFDGAAETFFPISRLSAVIMPFLEVLEAREEEEDTSDAS